MIGREDYSRSRVLAKVEHLGLHFGIVRKRVNGKPWRKYLVLIFNGQAVASCRAETDPTAAATWVKAKFSQCFTTREKLDAELNNILARGADC
jgi:hypothetical protein